MVRIFILPLFLSLNLCAQAPLFSWAKSFTGPDLQGVGEVDVDNFGNVYSGSYFSGKSDFDPGPGVVSFTATSYQNLALCKQDAAGNLIWAKHVKSKNQVWGSGIEVDTLNNLYVVGSFIDTTDFDPGPASYTLDPAVGFGTYIMKLRSNGDFVWAKKIDATLGCVAGGLRLDNNANLIFTGIYKGIADFDPGPGTFTMQAPQGDMAFVTKLDSSGNFIWAKQFTSVGMTRGVTLTTDSADCIYTLGDFQNDTDFDPGPGTYTLTSVNQEMYITKLDANGNFIFARQLGANCRNVAIDPYGNIITGGAFTGLTDFDPGPGTYTLTTSVVDFFILKLNASGNFVWVKASGTGGSASITSGIACDKKGNIYGAGLYQGVVDFDPGVATFTLNSDAWGDAFISKFDATGNFVWAGKMTSPGTMNNVEPEYIFADQTGNLFTNGSFQGDSCDLDPTAGNFTFTNSGPYDFEGYINKISFCVLALNSPSVLSFCSGGSSTLSASSPGSISWYGSPTSLNAIGTGTSYITPHLSAGEHTFYVQADVCGTDFNRTPIVINVNPIPNVAAVTTDSVLCEGESVSVILSGANSFTVNGLPVQPVYTISPMATTSYNLSGTDSNNCVGSSVFTQVVDPCTGVNDFEEAIDLKVWPNPANHEIFLSGSAQENAMAVIYDQRGMKVFENKLAGGVNTIPTTGLASGLYVLVISNDSGSFISKRFLKE